MKYSLVVGRQTKKLERVVNKKYTSGQRKICFVAFVSANLVDIMVLARLHYKPDDYKVLLLSNWNNVGDYKRIKSSGIDLFDEIILMDDKAKGAVREARFNKIKKQMKDIDFSSFDIMHISAFNQKSFIVELVNYISPKTKLIQNQFTGASYFIKEYYQMLSDIYVKHSDTILRLSDRIDELWVHDKRLIVGDTTGIVVRDMGFEKFYKNKKKLGIVCKLLNRLYGYRHIPIKNRIIFLEQPLYRFFRNDVKKEMNIFNKLFAILKPYNILVKAHPRCENDKYEDYDVDVLTNSKVPWEVVLLNELLADNLKDKIFITYFSDSLDNTHVLLSKLKINHFSIRTVEILRGMSKVRVGHDWLDIYTEKFMNVFKKNIYDVKSTKQLARLMKKIIKP